MFNNNFISILLIAAILVFVNLLAEQFYFRLDLTEDQQYTLSPATRNILDGLEAPVTIKAYFSDNLPTQYRQVRKDFEDLLVEYARLSGEQVVYQFINPSEEQIEREAQQAGVRPVLLDVRDKDQIKQQKAYLGAVIQQGNDKEVIALVQPGMAMEYELSKAIKKISVKNKPAIGIIQGHGEPPLRQLQQARSELSVLYRVEPYTLTDTAAVPNKYQTLALLAPSDSIPLGHLQQLDAFLDRGGNLLVGINRVSADLQRAYGQPLNTRLESWLQQKGVIVEPKFLVDANCGAVTVQQQQGGFRFASQVSFPYLPIISNFADHPVTAGLEAVVLQFASPLRFTGDTTRNFQPVAFSSGQSGAQQAPTMFNVQKEWTEQDFPLSKLPVAGLMEWTTANQNRARLLVIGDGDFPMAGGGRGGGGDNVGLLVNAIDWLSDDTGLVALRNKGIQYRPIDDLDDSTKTLLKYTNFLLPIVLVIGYGLLRFEANRRKRLKRMQESYG